MVAAGTQGGNVSYPSRTQSLYSQTGPHVSAIPKGCSNSPVHYLLFLFSVPLKKEYLAKPSCSITVCRPTESWRLWKVFPGNSKLCSISVSWRFTGNVYVRWLVPACIWMCPTTLRGITHYLQPVAAFTSLALTKALVWMHTYKPRLHDIDERHGFQSNKEQYYTEPLLTTYACVGSWLVLYRDTKDWKIRLL